jgi:hypothetical protein
MFERTAKAVQPPYHERIALAKRVENTVESRPLFLCSADLIDNNLVATGCRQGVLLKI